MQNKFFGSKLNTVLLAILIILMIIALRWMHQNKELYQSASLNKTQNTGFYDSLSSEDSKVFEDASIPNPSPSEMLGSDGKSLEIKWVSSPSNFGAIVLYPSNWRIMPNYYGSAAMQAQGKEELVGYDFTLLSGSMVIWGGAQAGCNGDEFGEFKYGVSSTTCVKGLRTSIGRASARESVSLSDLKTFGDFVLKNQQQKNTLSSAAYGYSIEYKGIEEGKGNDSNIFFAKDQSYVDHLEIVDYPYNIPSYFLSKGTVTYGSNVYQKFKDNITPRHTYYLKSGLKNNKAMFISVENDSDDPTYLDLSSLKILK